MTHVELYFLKDYRKTIQKQSSSNQFVKVRVRSKSRCGVWAESRMHAKRFFLFCMSLYSIPSRKWQSNIKSSTSRSSAGCVKHIHWLKCTPYREHFFPIHSLFKLSSEVSFISTWVRNVPSLLHPIEMLGGSLILEPQDKPVDSNLIGSRVVLWHRPRRGFLVYWRL